MRRGDRRWARRLTAATLSLALGWPLTASAMRRPAATRIHVPAPGEAEAEPSMSDPQSELAPPQPRIELSPEELAQRQLDLRLERAEIHWQEGTRFYQNGRYGEAAVEFERSYAAIPAAATLYSVALSYERAGKPVEAVRALERYLALPDCTDAPPEERTIDCTAQRPFAMQALAEQRRRVGELTLDLGDDVELREVRVAGRTVPLDDFPLLLLPGTVDVEVFGMGPEERRSRPAYITAGEVYELYVAPFDPEVAPLPTLRPKPEDVVDELRLARRQRRLETTFYAGAGLTVASGAALAVMGGLARYYQKRFNREKCDIVCVETNADGNTIPKGGPEDDLYPHDRKAAAERYRTGFNAMLGVTIGVGVVTALVGVFAFRKRGGVPTARGERARAHVRLGGPGLVMRW